MSIKGFDKVLAAQEKCRIWIMEEQFLQSQLLKLEAHFGCPKKYMKGCKVRMTIPGCQKYKNYGEQSTFADVEYTGKEWKVINAGRKFVIPRSAEVIFMPPEMEKAIVSSRYRMH